MTAIEPKPISVRSGGNIDVHKYQGVADAQANVKLTQVEDRAFNQILGDMFKPKNPPINSVVV